MHVTWSNMDHLPVPPNVLQALRKAKLLTVESILEYSQGDLERRTGLKSTQIQSLLEVASETILSQTTPLSALSLHQESLSTPNQGRLSTGCPLIDEYLHGGLLPRAINEIAGTSGAGKTQLCLQLSLTVQLPRHQGGLQGKAVYVSTEGALPSGRLQHLSQSVARRHTTAAGTLTDHILIHHCPTVAALLGLLQHGLPALLQQNRDVRLIVLDSLAALFRSEYSWTQMSSKTDHIKRVGLLLRGLLEHHDVTVVCTNQMTTDPDTGTPKPALGFLWSNMVLMRLVLLRDETVDGAEDLRPSSGPVPRYLRVEFAPHLPPTHCYYYIDNDGVHGLDDPSNIVFDENSEPQI